MAKRLRTGVKCSPYEPVLGWCDDNCRNPCNIPTGLHPPHRNMNYKEPVQHGHLAVPKSLWHLFQGQLILDTSHVTWEGNCRQPDVGLFNCNVMNILPEKRRKSKKDPKLSTADNLGKMRKMFLNILIIEPTRCTNFSNLLLNKTLHVSDSSSVHHHEFFTVNTAIHTGLLTGCDQQTCMTYTIAVCRVKNCWW